MSHGCLLVIEDEPLLGAEISRHYRKSGWEVELAASNAQARKLLLRESFDPLLVLTDMNLPDGNALDLMEEVRPKQTYAEWIFLTGYGSVPDSVQDATLQDWFTEYLAPIISIKVVDGVDEAIAHINHYSSHHTDAILSNNHQHIERFVREVDSSSVMVNASTRFADGFEYGLGAEIGISTDKFHARGPVGMEGLTSLKYVVLGQGQIRN